MMLRRSNDCALCEPRDRPSDRGAWWQDRADWRRLAVDGVRQHRRRGALCCQVQQQVPNHDAGHAPDRAIRFRIGIDIGDAIADGADLHGDGVIVAARLQAECPPGGICVSRAVRDHVHDRLDLAFETLGLLNLKNIARPVEAFVLRSRCGRTENPGRNPAAAGSAFDRRAGLHQYERRPGAGIFL